MLSCCPGYTTLKQLQLQLQYMNGHECYVMITVMLKSVQTAWKITFNVNSNMYTIKNSWENFYVLCLEQTQAFNIQDLFAKIFEKSIETTTAINNDLLLNI